MLSDAPAYPRSGIDEDQHYREMALSSVTIWMVTGCSVTL